MWTHFILLFSTWHIIITCFGYVADFAKSRLIVWSCVKDDTGKLVYGYICLSDMWLDWSGFTTIVLCRQFNVIAHLIHATVCIYKGWTEWRYCHCHRQIVAIWHWCVRLVHCGCVWHMLQVHWVDEFSLQTYCMLLILMIFLISADLYFSFNAFILRNLHL